MKSTALYRLVYSIISILILIDTTHAASGITPDAILLGQSAAFTGPSAGLGTELWLGAQSYFNQVNSRGGIHGRKIEVLSLDDKYDGEITLPNTLELITAKKVFGLFGYVGTPTLVKALPAIQHFSKEGLFLFSNFTGAQPQREPPHREYVLNVRPSYRQETKAIVDHLVKLGFNKFGLFIQDDAYGRSGADGVGRALKENGIKSSIETSYPRGTAYTADLSAQAKILQNARVEAIVSIGAYAACAAFIRDIRNLGFTGPIANVSFVGSSAMLTLLLEEESRTQKRYTQKLINTQVVPNWLDDTSPLVKEYLSTLKTFRPVLPPELSDPVYKPQEYSFGSLEGFLNAKILVEIFKRSPHPLTRKGFLTTLNHLGQLDVGLKERVHFSVDRHQALNQVYFTTPAGNHFSTITNWDLFR